MPKNNPVQGKLRAVQDRVIVSDMDFGEHVTDAGIVILSDDGKTRGVHPRWGKVYSKGRNNHDPYTVGDWVLVEHGRWTRGVTMESDHGPVDLRMVEPESIIMYSDTKPNDLAIGEEYAHGDSFTPEHFSETAKMVG